MQSNHHAEQHKTLWHAYLSRYGDSAVTSRKSHAFAVLRTWTPRSAPSASSTPSTSWYFTPRRRWRFLVGCSASQPSAHCRSDHLRLRAMDSEDKVRIEVISSVCEAARENIESVSTHAFERVAARRLDKKVAVRKAALTGLAELYRDVLAKCAHGAIEACHSQRLPQSGGGHGPAPLQAIPAGQDVPVGDHPHVPLGRRRDAVCRRAPAMALQQPHSLCIERVIRECFVSPTSPPGKRAFLLLVLIDRCRCVRFVFALGSDDFCAAWTTWRSLRSTACSSRCSGTPPARQNCTAHLAAQQLAGLARVAGGRRIRHGFALTSAPAARIALQASADDSAASVAVLVQKLARLLDCDVVLPANIRQKCCRSQHGPASSC